LLAEFDRLTTTEAEQTRHTINRTSSARAEKENTILRRQQQMEDIDLTDLVDLSSKLVCELESFEVQREHRGRFEDGELLLRAHFLLASAAVVQVVRVEFLRS
jgi:hypothetical protein